MLIIFYEEFSSFNRKGNFLFICNKGISDELEIRRYELASQKGS